MDRSELTRDLEFADGPQSVRTVPTGRPPVAAARLPGTPAPPAFAAHALRATPAEASSFYPPAGIAAPYGSARDPAEPGDAPGAILARGFSLARRAAIYLGYAVAGWLGLVLVLIAVYRFVDPPISALMLQHRVLGEDYRHAWVPIEAMSPDAVRAVIVSEDGRFCQHWGIDFDAMQSAFERSGDGAPRGASTISMQVAKNLFLWPSKSYLRKLIELPLTFAIEMLWPKRRIMEVYLNIAEWGPGVFGIEAAARHHFAKPAFRLTAREAAQLAAALPNPIRRDAGEPGPRTARLAATVQARVRASPRAAFACVR